MAFFKLLGLPYTAGNLPPAEHIHLIVKGLSKDPAKRFQSAAELIAVLHGILEGKVRVQCPITLTKRTFREMGRLVDRRPFVGFFALMGVAVAVLFAGVQLVRMVVA
jgi:eukaryotic-like serine/threonine-protein kinase